MTMAAFRPGAPVMDPPGWVEPPVWYRPGMGIRCAAQPGAGRERAAERRAPVAAVERAVDHVRVQFLEVLRGLDQAGQDGLGREIGHPLQPLQLVPGVLLLALRPAARAGLVDLRAEDLHGVLAGRCPARVGQRRGGHQHPRRIGEEPPDAQVSAHLDVVLGPAGQADTALRGPSSARNCGAAVAQ